MIELAGPLLMVGGAALAAVSQHTATAPSPTTVLGALVILGGGVITYLVRQVAGLKAAGERDERSIRTLLAVAAEMAANHPDPDIRDRVRRTIDALNKEHNE